jgi:hypothetical protein
MWPIVILTGFLLKLSSRTPFTLQTNKNYGKFQLNMVFSGIADKMGGVIEFLSGQQKITESNIEATLKVCYPLVTIHF